MAESLPTNPGKKRRSWWRSIGGAALILAVLLGAARGAMPYALRWYVNRTIDQNPLYDGKIGDVRVHLWRGAYSIEDVRLLKTTGNVPVPFFSAKRLDLAIQWDALLQGKIVGRVVIEKPELNFVDAPDDSTAQTGEGGPWLKMINDLFPFKINRTIIHEGSIHLRAFQFDPPVDVYLSQLEASVENLSNIRDELTPLVATVKAEGLAMDQARFQFQMKLNPFSYRPTFQMAVRLIGLDVTKVNALTRAYGAFDFEHGWFDLVVEVDAKEGQLEGYVKPLFRNLKVFTAQDVKEDNIVQLFWEALVGMANELLKNHPRDQFATVIPFRGDLTGPRTGILTAAGNVLRNAFIRAYLPRFEGVAKDVDGLQFGRGSVTEPISVDQSP